MTRRTELHGRTPRQVDYLRNIQDFDITFGIGPAGTGKTYLAVASAGRLRARPRRAHHPHPPGGRGRRAPGLPARRPGAEGRPYLRPLYDALYDLMGFDRVGKLFERGSIEIAPLAFMRGRTLNNAFIILDEAQNTTPEQMKMFLTRIGFGAKAVVTGDLTRGQRSGLRRRARCWRGARHRVSPNSARKTWCVIRLSRASSKLTTSRLRASSARRPRPAARQRPHPQEQEAEDGE